MITIGNIKAFVFALLVGIAVWFIKDYKHLAEENSRISENAQQVRKSDSLRFTSQTLNKDEIQEYLDYQNKDLKQKLAEANIKTNRIESIVSTLYAYKDTNKKEFDFTELSKSILSKIPKSVPFQDTTKCMTVKGNLVYKNDSLKLEITEKSFNNKSDAVAYWHRKEWSFLGIKTTFLGKKEFTAKTFDQCGKSQVLKIEKVKK
jgi:hypothetical protein